MDVKMSIFAIFRRQRRHRKSRRSAAVGCAEGGRTPAAELCHARSFIKKAQSPSPRYIRDGLCTCALVRLPDGGCHAAWFSAASHGWKPLDCALSGMLELADKPYSEILL